MRALLLWIIEFCLFFADVDKNFPWLRFTLV